MLTWITATTYFSDFIPDQAFCVHFVKILLFGSAKLNANVVKNKIQIQSMFADTGNTLNICLYNLHVKCQSYLRFNLSWDSLYHSTSVNTVFVFKWQILMQESTEEWSLKCPFVNCVVYYFNKQICQTENQVS
jgi:hypothetical protein